MDNQINSIMVAVLPQTADWCKLELPHTTIVYGGEVSSSRPTMFNELAKLASTVAESTSEFLAKVTGVETFGDEEKVSVLVLERTEELLRLRRRFEKWDDSDFSTYKPHATIGPEGTVINPVPMYLVFDRLAVVWGDQILSFRLKSYR
jgi:2'-5' RNA ligase